MKSVLYARVSSKEQEQEGYSIPAQKKLLQEYARKNEFEIVNEFIDIETAKQAGRTQFGKMIDFLRKDSETRIVLVEKTDRLYRNFRDYVLMEDLDIEIHLVKENEIISRDSRSHAKFIHGIKVLMAKNYIDNLSEEVQKGLREKAEKGEWPHLAPLGYINDRENHLIVPDPEKAHFIQVLFKLYASGDYSLNSVRDEIHRMGLRSRTGKKLAKGIIESTLKNPLYYGEFNWKGVLYTGVHHTLISKELYNRVQAILRRSDRSRAKRNKFAFRGLVKCGRCGCSMTGEIKKRKYIYYHCTQAKGKCDQPYIREEVLDSKFAEVVGALKMEKYYADWLIKSLKSHSTMEKDDRKDAYKRLKQHYDELQIRLDKSYEDRLDGVIDVSYWNDVSLKWRNEQNTLMHQMEKLQHADRGFTDEGVRVLELSQDAYAQYLRQNGEEKRVLLKYLLSNCTIDGLTIYPVYNKPFDFLVKGIESLKKLPRQDSNLRPAD